VLFPGADRTVSIWRSVKITEADGYNQNIVRQSIATGVPLHLRDLNADVSSTGAGREAMNLYRGACPPKTDVRVGDILKDETQNAPDGTPVQYEVMGATTTFAYVKMHLVKTAFS
jgi:hypothetical protein